MIKQYSRQEYIIYWQQVDIGKPIFMFGVDITAKCAELVGLTLLVYIQQHFIECRISSLMAWLLFKFNDELINAEVYFNVVKSAMHCWDRCS